MINNNKRYDLKEYNRGVRNRKATAKRRLAIMQKVFMVLLCLSVTLGLILLGGIAGKSATKDPDEPLFDLGNHHDSTETTLEFTDLSSSSDTAETTEPYKVEELISANPIADNYWGELVPCENPIPYEHYEVHGLYINAVYNLEENLAIADNSEINTLVIDLKEAGGIYFNSTNETAREIGYINPQYDLAAVVEECHAHGVRVIGRIVCFKDPQLVTRYPDRAICDSTGEPLYFYNEGSSAFASPYDARNWEYFIEIAEEAITFGVDEIQFDYVRFPTGATTSGNTPYYGIENEVPARSDAINRFLQTARIRIQDTLGVPLSADIFGIAVTSSLDGDILGQDWRTVGLTQVDSLCPMIYPSHYALGTILNGTEYPAPDKAPYEMMYNVLMAGSFYHNTPGYSTVRPYVQAFTAAYIGEGNYMVYDYDAINAQIRGLQDAGQTEFILWNASAEYPSGNYGGNRG